jgi:hypothetical protein
MNGIYRADELAWEPTLVDVVAILPQLQLLDYLVVDTDLDDTAHGVFHSREACTINSVVNRHHPVVPLANIVAQFLQVAVRVSFRQFQ